MADPQKVGRPWLSDELDVIVADYFAMLRADLAGERYVKSHHSAAVMARIGRTHRSVEFKHQNISAVLDELGLPWIPGYIPKRNYQAAIFGAIDRYLSQSRELLEFVPHARPANPSPGETFVDAPVATPTAGLVREPLLHLVRKFDPVERDFRNRSLGKAGEAFAFELEKRRLFEAGRPDLSRQVRWVAEEDGDGAGYDILSFEPKGEERLLEVKTTNGSSRTPFFLTRREQAVAREKAADWRIYRVHDFARNPRVFTLAPPLEEVVQLTPETWRASFDRS